jgi:tRNA-splicing ligase RtcB
LLIAEPKLFASKSVRASTFSDVHVRALHCAGRFLPWRPIVGIELSLGGGRVPVHVWTRDVDQNAIDQLRLIAQLPIVHGHIAAMPDVHGGHGATVGTVIPTRAALIPAAVGVDIGCGMLAARTTLVAADLPDGLYRLRRKLEEAVPIGFGQHAASKVRGSEQQRLARRLGSRLAALVGKHPGVTKMLRRFDDTWVCQLGTLGGGNHFIELCLDEVQRVWIMLHTGSRGIGNALGSYFIEAARKDMRRHRLNLPSEELAYVCDGSTLFDDYVEAVGWAQDYAALNRQRILTLLVDELRAQLPAFEVDEAVIDCHHNYVACETHFGESLWITRKGEIRAGAGDPGIVPGSMGAQSYIVRGLGEPQSYCSCAHGAGRRLSRGAARRRFTAADVEVQTRGLECRKDGGVIDEIPAAYKPIDEVMAQQRDLVEVLHTLRQVLCIKG